MNTGKIVAGTLAGLLIGGAAGAILGILFAPEKGSVTRKRLSLQKDQFEGELHHKIDNLAETLKEKFDSFMGHSSDLTEKGKAKAEEFKNRIKSESHA